MILVGWSLPQTGLLEKRHDLPIKAFEAGEVVNPTQQDAVEPNSGEFAELIGHVIRCADQWVTTPARLKMEFYMV